MAIANACCYALRACRRLPLLYRAVHPLTYFLALASRTRLAARSLAPVIPVLHAPVQGSGLHPPRSAALYTSGAPAPPQRPAAAAAPAAAPGPERFFAPRNTAPCIPTRVRPKAPQLPQEMTPRAKPAVTVPPRPAVPPPPMEASEMTDIQALVECAWSGRGGGCGHPHALAAGYAPGPREGFYIGTAEDAKCLQKSDAKTRVCLCVRCPSCFPRAAMNTTHGGGGAAAVIAKRQAEARVALARSLRSRPGALGGGSSAAAAAASRALPAGSAFWSTGAARVARTAALDYSSGSDSD